MALQLHKDSKDISTSDGEESRPTQSNSSNNSINVVQGVDPNNGQRIQVHGNERKNLEALLQLSTSLQTSDGRAVSTTDRPRHSEDNERESFLREAIKSLSTDIVGHIKSLIDTITKTVVEEERESALEEILENVCCIDIAKCFYQLGGLKIVESLLKQDKSNIRILAVRIISECCQNNPYCQEFTVEDDVFSSIMEVAKSDKDHTARFYAFSAISAIVRDNPEGLKQFKKYNGFAVLKDGLNLYNTRITDKISFFISYLSQIDGCKDDLVNADIVPALIEAITSSNDVYPVQALLSVMSNHPRAVQQTCQTDSGLRKYITSTIEENDHSEGDCELAECCSKIAQLMNDSGTGSEK